MYLLFVDESGTPPPPNKIRNRYFVIGGVVIPEDSWHPIRDSLMGLKIRRKIRGEFKWRYFAPGNDDARNPMRKLNQLERDEIRTEIYGSLRGFAGIRVIACVASIEAAYRAASVKDASDLYHGTYKPVSERFQYHLQDLSRASGTKQTGIVVADHRGAEDDKRFRMHHQKLLHASAEFVSSYRNLVESLFVQPSNLSVGIQLADLVAGAIWRKFERDDQRWYDMIEPLIRRSNKGDTDGYGIVRFPKSGWI